MARHNIPTARYKTFTEYKAALEHIQSIDYPIVIKASGLAAGKGVILPETTEEAKETLHNIMVKREFGDAGNEVVIEERLEGEEASILAFTDGYTVILMPAAQDHKRIFDQDQGPNTGGMGAYAPAPVVTPALYHEVLRRVMQPCVDGLRKEGRPFVGVLFAGLMLTPDRGAQVLEYNCRMGDPETQAVLSLLETDLYDIMWACVNGCLDSVEVKFADKKAAAAVVMAAPGYPNAYPKGAEITGLTEAASVSGVNVFHAGTKVDAKTNAVVTNGGRVLAVTGTGEGLQEALKAAYDSVGHIKFEGAQFRKDIGHRALKRLADAAAPQTAEITAID